MIIVDCELTGTNIFQHGLASIGAVELERPDRQFYGECRAAEDIHISEGALEINGFTEAELRDPDKQSEASLVDAFFEWAGQASEHTVAGQNPHFDVAFIQAASLRHGLNFPLAHRSIDNHSLCYIHIVHRGITPPVEKGRSGLNSEAIMEYVGIPEEPRPHHGLNGALYEAEALSRLLYGRNLLEQFAEYPVPWQNSESADGM